MVSLAVLENSPVPHADIEKEFKRCYPDKRDADAAN